MSALLRPALGLFLLLSLLTGGIYPFVVTGAAAVLAPGLAAGSLLRRDGRVVGSELVGQAWTGPRWFWGRPSATVPACNGAASGGSNLGPGSSALRAAVEGRLAALRAAHPGRALPVPVDLVTASGSGLDPHVSPAAARYQVERVARARGLDPARVLALVERHVEGRTFGLLGEPRVNVLRLNLALDALR